MRNLRILGLAAVFTIISLFPGLIPHSTQPQATKSVKAEDSCDWPSFGRNPDGNRVTPDGCGPKSKWPGKMWDVKLANQRSYCFSPPVTYENKAYCLNSDFLQCIDISTGKTIWKYNVGGYGSPCVLDNKIYFNSSKSLTCVDTDTGLRLWSYQTKENNNTSPIISEGCVYIGLDNKNLFCFDAITGELKCKSETDSPVSNNMAIFNNKLYYCTRKTLTCLDLVSQNIVWSLKLHDHNYNNLAMSNGKVYVCSGSNLYCIEAIEGKVVWKMTLPETTRCSPVIWDKKIYFGDSSGLMHCVQDGDGKEIWTFRAGGIILASPVVSDGKLYFGSWDNNLYCLDAQKGTYQWTFRANNHLINEITIARGKILVTPVTDQIYCIGDLEDKTDRNVPSRLEVYSESDSLDCCSTMQFHAYVLNQYNDVLSGYKFDWSVEDYYGSISSDGVLVPENEGQATVTCKTEGYKAQKFVFIGNLLYADKEWIEFNNVEPCTPTDEIIRFSQQENYTMKVKLSPTSDCITVTPSEFMLEPGQEVDVDIVCEIKKLPNVQETKFQINVDYQTNRTDKKCRKVIEGLIKFKKQ